LRFMYAIIQTCPPLAERLRMPKLFECREPFGEE
jgi:hypothetical protein